MMDFLVINQEKCLHDGICTSVCPHRILSMDQTQGIPVSFEEMEKLCVSCGHCVAVCPSGALTHRNIFPEKCTELSNGWRMTPLQVEKLLKGRRSIRKFRNQTVDKDILSQVIDIARYTPTGFNIQPVKWMILYNSSDVMKVCQLTIDMLKECIKNQLPIAGMFNMQGMIDRWEEGEEIICNGAPHLIITYASKDMPISQGACTMSLTYLEIAALPFGLGTCWAGFVNLAAMMTPEIQNILKIPEGYQIFGAMMIGYPKYEFHRIPLRNEPQIIWK